MRRGTMTAKNEKINSFEMAKKQVDIAAKYLNLDSGSIEKLKTYEEGVDCPLPRPDG